MDNKYVGKICPYCKTPFIEEDEIVVCNTCDMPHHKSCWIDNQGCTTFGCLGTIKAADSSQTTVTTNEINYEDSTTQSTMYCAHCGTQNNTADSFCKQCGNPLHNTNVQQNTYVNTSYQGTNNGSNNSSYQSNGQQSYHAYNGNQSTDTEIAQFVAVKGEYYMPKFQQMKAMNIKTSWNWCAFLVAPYWCIYRKMYAYGAGILGVNFVLNLMDGVMASVLSLALFILAGIFGNYIYMQDIEKRIAKSKAVAEPYRNQYVIQNSGVNPAAVTLVIIGFSILSGILASI